MGNENAVSGNNILQFHGRPVTRALASTLCASSKSSKESDTTQNQGRILRANPKRRALDEKKATAPKKQAFLKDITNVTVERSWARASSNVVSNQKFVDIDSDDKDPLLCSLYVPDIYYNLRVAELKRRPFPDFMEKTQRDVTQTMRGVLVDWLVEVSEEYTLVADTLYLTVYLIDWFLHGNYIERQRLQLLGITCMLIASMRKYVRHALRSSDSSRITHIQEIRSWKWRAKYLSILAFKFTLPLQKHSSEPKSGNRVSGKLSHGIDINKLPVLEVPSFDHRCFGCFSCQMDIEPINPPNPTLEHYTTYKASDLKASVQALQDLQLNTKGCPLNSIRMKYREDKFKSVAVFTSPKLPDKLF